jgi:hypothetical protein
MIETFFDDGHFVASRMTPLPVHLAFFPDGWTSPLELQLLYNLARYGTGELLEIGSWIGRSTVALALGVRDRVDREGRCFDVIDYGLASFAEFEKYLSVPIAGIAKSEKNMRPLLAPGGVIGCLIDNLRQRDLLWHVTAITKGGIASVPLRPRYDVVFCDAVHSEREIRIAGPVIARIVSPGAWLMCDDLRNSLLVTALEEHVQFDFKVHLRDHDPASKSMIARVKTG